MPLDSGGIIGNALRDQNGGERYCSWKTWRPSRYQIDRMLMQLKLAGHLDAVRGIVFGEMLDCVQSPMQDYTLQEVIKRIVGDLAMPVAFGVKSGHVTSRKHHAPVRSASEACQCAMVR